MTKIHKKFRIWITREVGSAQKSLRAGRGASRNQFLRLSASKIRIYTRPKDIYMRLKCLVKNMHWIRAHISRTHFETNGQPYDITGKYLYVEFPRMKTLKCKTFKNIY